MEVTLVGASWDVVAGVEEEEKQKTPNPPNPLLPTFPKKSKFFGPATRKGRGGGAALPHLAPPLRPPSPSPMPPGPLVLTYLELQTATGDFAR